MSRKRRIGVFGGMFDPIHNGHLAVAKVAQRELNLDRVIFFPTGNPVHKKKQKIAPFNIRYLMVKKAIEPYESFEVSKKDNIPDTPSYTELLLKRIMKKDSLYFLLIGGDTLAQLTSWHNYKWILNNVKIAVIPRGKYNKLKNSFKTTADISILKSSLVDVSSTQIREDFETHCRQLPVAIREIAEGVYQKSA